MRLLVALPLIFATALPASAQTAENRRSIWSIFTFERIASLFINQAVMTARAAADIRYDGIQMDPIGATLHVVGVNVAPKIPGLADGACVLLADRMSVRGAPLDDPNILRARITLDNALVDFDCFPNEVRPMIGLMGVGDLEIARLDIEVVYDMPSGAAKVQLQAGVDGLVRILADADIDYISYRMNFATDKAEPAVLVNSVRLQVEDLGLGARAQQVLPPEMRDPASVQTLVRTQIIEAMPPQMRSDATFAFADDAGAVAAQLAAGGKRAVLETAITNPPLRIDEALSQSPPRLFAALSPRIATAPRALDAMLPLDLIKAAQNGAVPPQEALRAGRALITGVGAPRNVSLGVSILTPLAEARLAEASFLIAQALAPTDARRAYSFAAQAAEGLHAGALALLDEIESQLALDDVLASQDAQVGKPDIASYDTLGNMRAAALDHMLGTGAPRSYRAAYFLASLAAAAGDSASAALRTEIDERMRVRGLAGAWSPVVAEIEDDVLAAWMESDLPARLQAE